VGLGASAARRTPQSLGRPLGRHAVTEAAAGRAAGGARLRAHEARIPQALGQALVDDLRARAGALRHAGALLYTWRAPTSVPAAAHASRKQAAAGKDAAHGNLQLFREWVGGT